MKTALPHRFLIACLILLIGLFLQACSTQPEHDRLHTMMDEAEEYQSDQNPYNDDADSDSTDAGLWADSNDDFEQEYTFWTYMSHRLSE